MMNSVNAFVKKCYSKMFLKSYSHDSPQDTKVRKVVFDVLQLDFSSPEWAATLLPAWVLSAEFLGEVVGFADSILTKNMSIRYLVNMRTFNVY
jgi:hypothetical protein